MASFKLLPGIKSFACGVLATAIVLSMLVISAPEGAGIAFAAEESNVKNETKSNVEFERLAGEVEELVKEFYPRAKFEKSADLIHFEFKAKQSSAGPGSKRLILAPKVDGIVGDLKLEQGRYKTDKILPFRVNEMFWVSLLMAPYSEPDDCHVYTTLLYPPQAPIEFVNSLRDIVSSFEKKAVVKEEKEEAGEKVALKTSETAIKAEVEKDVTEEKEIASRPSAEEDSGKKDEPQVDFGAPKFSDYSFSEGRFKIKLPGSPDVSCSNRAGMRFVDYKYLEPQGLYNIGYAILPGNIRSNRQDQFLNSISQALIKASKGKLAKNNSLNWQGYPGRQIAIDKLGGKDNRSSLLRIILVKNYFYMLQAAGTTPWVESNAVKTVLNSLEIRPTLTAEQKYLLKIREMEKENERRRHEWEVQRRNQRPHYNHRYEKYRADRKYRRY